MDTFAIAIVSVTAIGFLCAVILAVASKVMKVTADEKVERIRAALPGVNCGACGCSGCDKYAEALVHEGAKANACIPGGNAVSEAISAILGIKAESVAPIGAVVHCRGDGNARRRKMEYTGIETCIAEKQLFGGQYACTFGCLGYGDCAAVCPEGAICIENGLARIDSRKCMGCGMCEKVCPNKVIYLEEKSSTAAVLCKNTQKGAIVRKQCASGCIGCSKCVRECPSGAISMVGSLAKIDYSKCSSCGKCAEVCVTKCISLLSI